MTRAKSTDAELRMEQVLLQFLSASDPSTKILSREISDKPDIAVQYLNFVIACECVQIPSSEIIQWSHKRIPRENPDLPYCHAVIWAEEPHYWVYEAVKKKKNKIVGYRKNVGADEVWLLIHTPLEDTQVFVRGDFPWEAQMLRHGASNQTHGFQRILFWEPRTGIQEIFRPGQNVPAVKFDFTGGYPSRASVGFGGYPFKAIKKGEPPIVYKYETVRPKKIIVPPSDPEFAKHGPKFRDRSYTVNIVAHETTTEMTTEIKYDDEA